MSGQLTVYVFKNLKGLHRSYIRWGLGTCSFICKLLRVYLEIAKGPFRYVNQADTFYLSNYLKVEVPREVSCLRPQQANLPPCSLHPFLKLKVSKELSRAWAVNIII